MFDDFDFGQSDDYEYENPMDSIISAMTLLKILQQRKKSRLEKERKMHQNENQNDE